MITVKEIEKRLSRCRLETHGRVTVVFVLHSNIDYFIRPSLLDDFTLILTLATPILICLDSLLHAADMNDVVVIVGQNGKKRVKLCCLHPDTYRSFRVLNLHMLFDIYESIESALAAFDDV